MEKGQEMDDTGASTGAEAGEEFSLSLSGTGLKIDRKIGQVAALQILAIAMGGGTENVVPIAGAPSPTPAATRGGSRISLREYLDEVDAKRNPDKILTIGKYLQKHRGQEGFTANDVKGQFRAAGESAPANFPRDFRWTVTNGWIAEDHAAPGQYYVTSTGDEALAAKFAKEIKKKTGLDKATRRRRPKKKNDGTGAE